MLSFVDSLALFFVFMLTAFSFGFVFHKLLESFYLSLVAWHKKRKNNQVAFSVIQVSLLPTQFFVWSNTILFGVQLFFWIVMDQYNGFNVEGVRVSLSVLALGVLILRWLRIGTGVMKTESSKWGVPQGVITSVSRLLSVLVCFGIGLLVLGIMGYNVTPLLTFSSIGVAGLAFAAQDVFGNLFAGLMLRFTQPFMEGDLIGLPSQSGLAGSLQPGFIGVVEEIGWYITTIRDMSTQRVSFPNSLFSKMSMINMSSRTHQRMSETFSLQYDDLPALEDFLKNLKHRMSAHAYVDTDKPISVVLSKYAPSGVEILIILSVAVSEYAAFLHVKQELLFIINEMVQEAGLRFAYPRVDLSVLQGSLS